MGLPLINHKRVYRIMRLHGLLLTRHVARGLALRHDHGSQFIADDFQQKIAFLGIKELASYVREPQDNGIAERFVRILKENLLWVRSFRTVEELRLALLAFKETYNHQWRIGRHGTASGWTRGSQGAIRLPAVSANWPALGGRRLPPWRSHFRMYTHVVRNPRLQSVPAAGEHHARRDLPPSQKQHQQDCQQSSSCKTG